MSRADDPVRPDFAVVAERSGIDPAAPPEAPDGPVLGSCEERLDRDQVCLGTIRLVAQDGHVWIAACDQCGFECGVPAHKLDKEIARQFRLERAGLPSRFVGARFEQNPDTADALAALRSWLEEYKPEVGLESLIPAPALWGLAGRGKSHLLTGLCQRLINELGLSVLFRSARQLLRELQQFEHPEVRDQAWTRAVGCDVLALDDLGAQQQTDWRSDQLADLVDERYAARRPVVLATNFAPSTWEQAFDARTFSRLRGMTFPVELKGPDRRLTATGEGQ